MVVARNPDVPIYTVRPESGRQIEKIVHRNNMLACNFLLGTAEKDMERQKSNEEVKNGAKQTSIKLKQG